MRRYRVQHDYRSGPYTWAAGDLVELDDDAARWVGNDSPGCIAHAESTPPPDADETETERQVEPPRDRQARPGRNRGAR